MKIGRSLIVLSIAAIVAGVAAVYLANHYISSRVTAAEASIRARYKLVPVVVPQHNMKAGDIVSSSNMAVRKIPKEFLNTHAITPAAFSAVQGRQLAVPIEAGTPLLREQISEYSNGAFSARVRGDKRALTVPVNTVSSVGGLLSPGDRVDILLTAQARDQKPATVPLLSDVRVLATGTNYLAANHQTFRDVTFELTPKNASRLLLAQRVGTISTTLLGPDHSSGPYEKAVTPANLFTGRFAYLFGVPPAPKSEPSPPLQPAPIPIQLIVGHVAAEPMKNSG